MLRARVPTYPRVCVSVCAPVPAHAHSYRMLFLQDALVRSETSCCVTTLCSKLALQDSGDPSKPPSAPTPRDGAGAGVPPRDGCGGGCRGGSCPSGGGESAAVSSTEKEQFSQREPEIMIYINGLSNELAKIDAPSCSAQGMRLFLFACSA